MSTEYIKYKNIKDYEVHSKNNNCTVQVCAMWIWADKLWAETYQVDIDGSWHAFDNEADDWRPVDIDYLVNPNHIDRKTFIGHEVKDIHK